MSFYNMYVYIVTILVSRCLCMLMTTCETLPNVTERYRISCSKSLTVARVHIFPPYFTRKLPAIKSPRISRSRESPAIISPRISRHNFPANLPPFLDVCSCASSPYSFSYPRQYSKIHHISFCNLTIYLFAILQYIFSQSCNISHIPVAIFQVYPLPPHIYSTSHIYLSAS